MSWIIVDRLATHDFDVVRDPIGRFPTKSAAVAEYVQVLERQRADLSRAMRKARQMLRRARAKEAQAIALTLAAAAESEAA